MKRIVLVMTGCLLFAQDIDKTPSWYTGSKPWQSIGREGREKMLQFRAASEAAEREANKPAVSKGPIPDAKKGEELIRKTAKKFGLDKWYLTPDTFGKKMVIWIPEKAWKGFSEAEKNSIEAYVKSKYQNWGVGVGRMKGREVLFDRLVRES